MDKLLPLVEKILLLESRLGERWTHTTLEPFKFDSSDLIKVQDAGKKIAQHLGLPPFTFIITYTQQKPNVGGHINLDYSNDVLIEIDYNYRYDYEIVSAILSHEICHKYLHINNIQLFPTYENEILTDAATIYTGLGKLTLNGCEKKKVSTSYSFGKESTTTHTTTSTNRIGYLDKQQFAFLYYLVSHMRRIPKNDMLQGLNSEAANEVLNIGYYNNNYFNEDFFNNEYILKAIAEAVKNEIGTAQKHFARFNKNIRVIQETILPNAKKLNAEFHSYVKSKTENLNVSAGKSFSKEAHNYVKNFVAVKELELLIDKIKEKETETLNFRDILQSFIYDISKKYSKQNLDYLLQFECPGCNNKMRISAKKLVRICCPRCSYSFIIDAEEEISNAITKENNLAIKQPSRGLWEKIKSLFFTLLSSVWRKA